MILLNTLKAYLQHVQEVYPQIKKADLVTDDNQINKFVEGCREGDIILMMLIPSVATQGNNEGAVHDKDRTMFILVSKNDRKIRHSQFIDKMAICQELINNLRKKLINDMEAYNDGCSFLSQLEISSIGIDPVFNLSGTDGYEMEFSLKSDV